MGRPSQCWQSLAPKRQELPSFCEENRDVNSWLELASEWRPATECKERVLGAKLPQRPGLRVDDWQLTVIGLLTDVTDATDSARATITTDFDDDHPG